MIKESTALEVVALMDSKYTTSETILLTFIERCCSIGFNYGYIIDELF